jgi:hypothetical protein
MRWASGSGNWEFIALGAQRKEVLEAALGLAFKLFAVWSAAG